MSKRKREFHRKIKPWAKKHFKTGSPMIPPDIFFGFGEKKPLICSICGKRVYKITIKEDKKEYCEICK